MQYKSEVFQLHSWEWPIYCSLTCHPILKSLITGDDILQCQKLGKIFTCPTYKLLTGFTVILICLQVLYSKITTFTIYCFTQWFSRFSGSFEILWVRQHLVNRTDLADRVNTAAYRTKPIFTGLARGKLFFLTLILKYKNHHRQIGHKLCQTLHTIQYAILNCLVFLCIVFAWPCLPNIRTLRSFPFFQSNFVPTPGDHIPFPLSTSRVDNSARLTSPHHRCCHNESHWPVSTRMSSSWNIR